MAFGLSIVVFFVALVAIILIHEGGHYLTARAFGFRVLEFFVGFGPRLWSTQRGEIEYGVKAIPAGGYVKIAGMNPFENDVPPGDEDRAYNAKPVWQRAIVILAGPVSHIVVAFLIFSGLLFFVGDLSTKAVVGGVVPHFAKEVTSPAAAAGLQPGDQIVQISDVTNPTPAQIGQVQSANVGTPIAFPILRDGREIHTTMTPVYETVGGQKIARIGITLVPVRRGPLSSLVGGVGEVGQTAWLSVKEIGRVFGPSGIARLGDRLFSGAPSQAGDPTTVVGIGRAVGTYGQQGQWITLIYTFAYVTLFIGLVNLLPLPPFDGGHLAVLVLEKIRGHQIDMKKVVPVSFVVLTFFVLFVTATFVLDIWKPVPISP
ncbi:MAG: M50 family metallopeptidase [Actinomycetota bacterium]